MDDHIIRIQNSEAVGHVWKMTIDLKELAASAGLRKKLKNPSGGHYNEEVLSVPMARARKLLKLIRDYGTPKDWEACDKYFSCNEKLMKAWRDLIG